MNSPQPYTVRLESKEKVSKNVYLVTFALVRPPIMEFAPGQHVLVRLAQGMNRSMSIASVPGDAGKILMCHDVSPMGPFSQWTINAKIGDELTFFGPLGIFTMDPASSRRKVFVATGTGIAPLRSMIRHTLAEGDMSSMALYWGMRHEEDLYWQEEFAALAVEHPNFHFFLTLSQPSQQWSGARGRVTDHVFTMEKNLANSDVYLCGNRAMVEEMRVGLIAQNVPKEQIKTELFY